MDVLFALVGAGDFDVAWDLCEQEGIFMPEDVPNPYFTDRLDCVIHYRRWAHVGTHPHIGIRRPSTGSGGWSATMTTLDKSVRFLFQ